ncbi:MAG: CsbD family protein [Proteobacteria bacterium]|nr:MAG: CsbD family protein [Pseudomonadota bacterium]
MNPDTLRGHFRQLRGKIKERWGRLTDDEIDQIEGRRDILVGKLQERYGWEREEVERQVKEFATRHGWR